MAFGMRYAPATFQRLMNVVLVGLLFCAAYLDDLVVHSESRVDHMEHLSVVFCHLKIENLSKCEFGQVTVTYLGKEVGGVQVRPVKAKVGITLFPVPTNPTELCRFLVRVSYYRSICQNFQLWPPL